MEEEEAHTETLICFFRYSPYFPPCPPRERPPLPCLLSPLSFFFCHYFPSSSTSFFSLTQYASPRPTATPARPFSPSNSSLFLLRCSTPPPRLSPVPFPATPTSTDARARVLFIHVAPAFFRLFFLSFFPCRSRCPWSVISRRGGDENARLGLRAVASSFCRRRRCLPPPSTSSSYSIRLRSFLALFFSPVPRRSYSPRTLAAVAR